jgi:hypothetical protein
MIDVAYLATRWEGSAWQHESTLHQLSPYIGKTKSTMAASLVARFSRRGELVCDPFSGCGTFAFEAWRAGRHVIANDLSPYASLLTRAKLFPHRSLPSARADLTRMAKLVELERPTDLRQVPAWVRAFFHPETLREAIAWSTVLRRKERWFLLACLMGILHHQRPGFLSFPSSHTVPYLRIKNFPPAQFPEMYEYRAVVDRLAAKVERAFRRVPKLNFDLSRHCFSMSADAFSHDGAISTILTSPPYMRQLDYGRDNRLRLWFLGCPDWQSLDSTVSPGEDEFLRLMAQCFEHWHSLLKTRGVCVLVMGDGDSRESRRDLPKVVSELAIDRGFALQSQFTDSIPNERRVRRGLEGSTSETVLVLRKAATRTRARQRNGHAATL